MRPNIRELIPSEPQQVLINLPKATKASQIKLLVAGITIPVRQTGGSVSLTLQPVLDHEVIAIDLT